MWDLAENGAHSEDNVNVDSLRKETLPKVVTGLNNYLSKLQKDDQTSRNQREIWGAVFGQIVSRP